MVRFAFLIFILCDVFIPSAVFAGNCRLSEGLSARVKALMSCGDYSQATDRASCLEGQKLFYDSSLSPDGKASCGSCHVKDRQYSDERPRPFLRGNELALSRTISLNDINRRSAPYFWNGRAESLEGAIYWPIYQSHEIGATPAHLDSFGGGKRVTRALALYIKTFNSEDAPFDSYAKGNCAALSKAAQSGLRNFKSAACTSCHQGSEFAGEEVNPYSYENLPEANFNNEEARYGQDWELHRTSRGDTVTLEVKAPSLRNLPRSGPFGQFGQSLVLEEYLSQHIQKVPLKHSLNRIEQTQILRFLREGLSSKD